MPTILICIALLVIVFFAIRSIVKSRGSCSGCKGCHACGTHTAGPPGEAAVGGSSCNHCSVSGQINEV